MNINLKESDIITALKQYVTNQGIDLTGRDVKISFTAGRKQNGVTAALAIDEHEDPVSNASPTKPGKQGKAAKAAAASKQAAEPPVAVAVPEPAVSVQTAEEAGASTANPYGEDEQPSVEEAAQPVSGTAPKALFG